MKLETPIRPRFEREGLKFVVSAPKAYLQFAWATVATGTCLILIGLLGAIVGFMGFEALSLFIGIGTLVVIAGFLAHLSLDFAEFNIKERTYRRRLGSGSFRTLRKGGFSELDKLAISHGSGFGLRLGQPVVRIMLYWKNPSLEPLVVFDDIVSNAPGVGINDYNTIRAFGGQVSQALGVSYQIEPYKMIFGI